VPAGEEETMTPPKLTLYVEDEMPPVADISDDDMCILAVDDDLPPVESSVRGSAVGVVTRNLSDDLRQRNTGGLRRFVIKTLKAVLAKLT
jgi:hypothetical protein